MKTLTAHQTEGLTQLINVAFGLTAAKLSDISGANVVMESPRVAIRPLESAEAGPSGAEAVTILHQVFTGPISGDAILFLDSGSAVKLSNLLVEVDLQSVSLESAAGEILTEVANMLLSACLGVFGNLLQVRIRFAIPRLHLESAESFLASLSDGADEPLYDLGTTAAFQIRDQGVAGRIAIILGASALDRLIQAMERWEASSVLAKADAPVLF